MPRVGMEPLRRAALIDATIEEIGRAGSLDVTVGRIARRAGVSSGLAHHYFGGKDQIFVSAMRHILRLYGRGVLDALASATGPRERLLAIVTASFDASNFGRSTVSAWLNFYALAQTNPDARRLLQIYYTRLRSNLVDSLRPLIGSRAPDAAERLAALIDGLYLRVALTPNAWRQEDAARHLIAALDAELNTWGQ